MPSRLMIKKGILLGLFVFPVVFFFSLKGASAQTVSPKFLLTWKASNSYVPSFYTGKAFATPGSKVTASLELISPTGKRIDISSQDIYWYEDEVLVGGGAGVQQVTFTPFGAPPSSLILDVELPQYSGGYLTDTVNIPFVDPVAVISAPYPNQEFSTNLLEVQGLPFFFYATSTDNLLYNWSVNGQTGSNAENPQVADITVPEGTPGGTSIAISLSIKDPYGSTVATANQNLTFQNQL